MVRVPINSQFIPRHPINSAFPPPNMPTAVGPGAQETATRGPENGIPSPLRAGHDNSYRTSDVVTSRTEGPADLTPRSSSDSQRSASRVRDTITDSDQVPTNPYYRMKSSQMAPLKDGNSTGAWADERANVPEGTYGFNGLCECSSETSIHHRLLLTSSAASVPVLEHSLMPHDELILQKPPFAEPWTDPKPLQEEHVPLSTTENDKRQAEIQKSTEAWNSEQLYKHAETRQPLPTQMSYTKELQELEAHPFQTPAEAIQASNANSKPLPAFPGEVDGSTAQQDAPNPWPQDQAEDLSSPQPLRSQSHEEGRHDPRSSVAAGLESQQQAAKQQRNETYQIRHVNWFDASAPLNLRRSPIMVQNANGPCPLLALVNALVLSTPADVTTALVETLRVREQVSLGLLLDAVIDELISGRRGEVAEDLPDVSDLYAFLINLHTGMNVNPRFMERSSTSTHLMDAPAGESPDQAAETRRPGGFEDTPHMRLYSTFGISLVHGWLPRKNHPVCDALRRCAQTYEDAQSLLFAEEDLENKLQSQGLTIDEQRLLEDIATVKHFLTTSPTQLTDYGLDTITEKLEPGAMTILFRNDHFSTLYKHPRSGRIFTLVTDMGYAGHDEVVWESLVDISGEGSEFFSGDFRPVGNNIANNRRSAGSAVANDAGWTTVPKSGRRSGNSLPPHGGSGRDEPVSVTSAFTQLSLADHEDTSTLSNTEQEDHDLALAMQLQEEEEDRERQEVAARRRREDELSRAYLDSARVRPPQVPPRGGGARRASARKQTDSEDTPPPSYEQAAKASAYQPPKGNSRSGAPSRPNLTTEGAQAARPIRQTSAYSETSSARPSWRRQQPEKEKDCIVM